MALTAQGTIFATAAVPGAFASPSQISAAAGVDNQIVFTVSALPAENGAQISTIEYKIDAGGWTTMFGLSPQAAKPLTFNANGITPGGREVRVRARNSQGAGPETFLGTVTVTGTVLPIPSPQSSGSGITFNGVFSAVSEGAVTGDVILANVQVAPTTMVPDHYEIAIGTPGSVSVERVMRGDWTNYERRHRGPVNGAYRAWMRAVDENGTASEWSNPVDDVTTTGVRRVVIEASRTETTQHSPVHMRAFGYGFGVLEPRLELHPRWQIVTAGEAGDHTRLPADFVFPRDRTTAHKDTFAFAPKTTGTIEVQCTIEDGAGNEATASVFITSVDVDTRFAGAKTFYLDHTGTHANGPAGAIPHTDVNACFDAARASSETEVRILVEPGGDHDLINGVVNGKTRFALMRNDAGSGADPIFRGARITNDGDEFLCYGIDHNGGYEGVNPVAGSGNFGTGGVALQHAEHAGVNDCRFRFNDTAIEIGQNGLVRLGRMTVVNTEIYAFRNFGIFGGDVATFVAIGLWDHQHPQFERREGTGDVWADHGPFRSSRRHGKIIAFIRCKLHSCTSWNGHGTSAQRPLRLHGSTPGRHAETTISQVQSEGFKWGLGPTSSQNAPSVVDTVVFGLDHTATMQPKHLLEIDTGLVLIESSIFRQPNVNKESNGGTRSGIHCEGVGTSGTNSNEWTRKDGENNPIVIRNVTYWDARTGAANSNNRDFAFVTIISTGNFALNDVRVYNLLPHGPGMLNPPASMLPLNLANQWTPEYLGRYVFGETPDLSFATPASITASLRPEAGSPAINGATGTKGVEIAIRDAQGNAKIGTGDLGYLEAA